MPAVELYLSWLLGLLSYWWNTLRPGVLAHGLQDVIGAVVAMKVTSSTWELFRWVCHN